MEIVEIHSHTFLAKNSWKYITVLLNKLLKKVEIGRNFSHMQLFMWDHFSEKTNFCLQMMLFFIYNYFCTFEWHLLIKNWRFRSNISSKNDFINLHYFNWKRFDVEVCHLSALIHRTEYCFSWNQLFSIVTSLVKLLLSRNFCQERISTLCTNIIYTLRKFILTERIFRQNTYLP